MKQISPLTGICFFKIAEAGSLDHFLQSADYSPLVVQPTASLISEWFDYGCIYVDGKRQRINTRVAADQVVRLHTRHKRYYREASPLGPRIVENNSDFLVLDKPAGLPTHPTLDNFIENAKVLLERELQTPLYTTHRLDIPTQGLLILAKTPDAQRLINRLFSLGKVKKIYRSLNARAVPTGMHIHFMDPESRVPKIVQSEEIFGWWRCQLRVDQAQKAETGYWHELTLLTGKTHQIRAQMLALGAPIRGDDTYFVPGEMEADVPLGLECYQLEFSFHAHKYSITRPRSIVEPQLSRARV